MTSRWSFPVLALILATPAPALALAPPCHDWAPIASAAKAEGARELTLGPQQFDFARGAFMGSPPLSDEMVVGDSAVMVWGGTAAMIYFLDGSGDATRVCEALAIPLSWPPIVQSMAVVHERGRT